MLGFRIGFAATSSTTTTTTSTTSTTRSLCRLGITALLLFTIIMAQQTSPAVASSENETYYAVLQLSQTATLQEIKKAYRKLALQHHPDRNPPEKKDQATIQFRRVNEAYEVLSDEDQRRQYDADLKYGRAGGDGGSSTGFGGTSGNRPFYHPSRRHYRDPFAQFNDLFQNDPFFSEAFKDMDDLFAKTFQQQHGSQSNQRQMQAQPPAQKSWGRWIADCLGIDFQVSTSTTTIGFDGKPVTSKTHTAYGGSNPRRRASSTYTSKSTRTVIENGQRVTIQSLEKDGNKIEEKYVNNELIQRLINGIPEQQYRLDGGDL